jgi:hypothetical protein
LKVHLRFPFFLEKSSNLRCFCENFLTPRVDLCLFAFWLCCMRVGNEWIRMKSCFFLNLVVTWWLVGSLWWYVACLKSEIQENLTVFSKFWKARISLSYR